MALIVRYVKIDSREVQIKKPFLNFFPLHRKNANEITKCILDELQQNDLDIMMCEVKHKTMLPTWLDPVLEYNAE